MKKQIRSIKNKIYNSPVKDNGKPVVRASDSDANYTAVQRMPSSRALSFCEDNDVGVSPKGGNNKKFKA